MPKREDEYWAGMKEPEKGRGLCPFCGSSHIYYNRRYESWRCGKCEKSFPSPSYGPGGDFGKEARWFGKTTDEAKRREFAEVARKARAIKGEHPRRSGKSGRLPGWLIPAVVIVLLVMFGTVVWALWGSDITDFFSTTSTSPPTEVSELSPEEAATPPDTSSGGVIIPSSGDGVSVFDSKQPPYSKTLAGERIDLINNSDATDPTWQQLKTFLLTDITDEKDYSLFSFPCGAFAEEVHNNAEAAGIRAAWVCVDFESDSEGHALNAFNTVDKGLVYVDCTGRDVLAPLLLAPLPGVEHKTFGEAESWDKIVYVEIGEEYGSISLEVASSPPYSYYEQYRQRVQSFKAMLEDYKQKVIAFNLEVEEYSRWIEGKVFYEGTAEALKAEEWFQELGRQENILQGIQDELDRAGNSLGAFWEPLGIVNKVEIYW